MNIRRLPVFSSILILIVLATGLIACKPASRTGANASGKPSTIQKKWELPLGDRSDGALALSADGTIIAACRDGYVYAVDSNGSLQWKTYIGATSTSPAIGSDGAIYIANDNGAVYALNRSGSQRWKSIVYEGNTYGHSAPAIGRSFLYMPSRNGLKILNLSNGRVEWSTSLGTEQWGAVTLLSDGAVLFGSHGRLHAVNTQGDSLWQYPPLTEEALQRNGGFPPPGNFFVSSGITPGPDRLLLMGMGHNQLAAVGRDGALRWQFDSPGPLLNTAAPIISSDGSIYFVHSDGRLYAFDSFGAKKWVVNVHGYVPSTPVLAADGTIFVVAERYLYSVSPAGEVLAQIESGASGTSSPTLAPDGTLFVLNDRGVLAAYVGGHGALMDSPWPKFQGDLANSGNQHSD